MFLGVAVEEWLAIGRGALLAGGGAAFAYLVTYFGQMDWAFAPILGTVFSVLLNYLRKLEGARKA